MTPDLGQMCDERGVVTTRSTVSVLDERGGPATMLPFVYDLRLHVLAQARHQKQRAWRLRGGKRQRSVQRRVPISPEQLPHPRGMVRDSTAGTRKRLDDLDCMTPTVGQSFPMVREPCDAMFLQDFLAVVRTHETADWHTAYNATARYGHLHIPAHHLVRTRSASKIGVGGLSRELRRAKPYSWLRQVAARSQYAPRLSQRLGGIFVITPEMRAQPSRSRGDCAGGGAKSR